MDQSESSVVTDDAEPPQSLAKLTTEIVSAYVSHNEVAQSDLAALINTVASQLAKIRVKVEPPAEEKPEPAVSMRRSIRPGQVVCLVCGKPHKTLKRHLGGPARADAWRVPRPLWTHAPLPDGGPELHPAAAGRGARDWPGAAEEAGSSGEEGGRTATGV